MYTKRDLFKKGHGFCVAIFDEDNNFVAQTPYFDELSDAQIWADRWILEATV